ncbi:anaerobic ribonucleoside-triphosphate reductase activating protein [Thomasclavelia sp.]|uniref:anaerobic ribonucleoside-triphosphate reductase activating protein n=1 Tax=Thomasclavelia sp. TaxID=3025757 RepID=UPI0025D58779|nr:anaerobic ribonucleoside-triphosphate reductase activating protein [Thomasclavelia sp.]
MKIRLFGTANDSIVDGPGLRYTIFTQGCNHNCPGCHNPGSHDLNGGYLEDVDKILAEIFDNPILDGITLSGGEPLLQTKPLIYLCQEAKKHDLNIVLYSGFEYEEIIQDQDKLELLKLCDLLVDGRFIMEKKSLSLLYRGSSNQRLINVQETLKQNQVIEYVADEYGEIVIGNIKN